MQGAAIRPRRAQLTAAAVGLCVLTALAALLPVGGAAFALLVPLFGCPLLGGRRQWLAWLAAAAPAVCSLLSGFAPLYSVALLFPGGLPLLCTLWLRRSKKLATPAAPAYFVAAYAAGLTLVAAAASLTLGGSLSHGLAQLLTDTVAASAQPGALLYRFALAGLAAVPEGYRGGMPVLFLLDAGLIRQMLLSLRLHTQLLLEQTLPSLFVQACLWGGVMTALRVQRACCAVLIVGPDPKHPGGRKTRVAEPPGFRLLMLPVRLRWVLCGMGLISLALLTVPHSLPVTLGLLLYAAFTCAFQMLGASVLLCLLAARHPDRLTLYGLLVAVLYLMFPLVLFLLGIADQGLHLRTRLLESGDFHKED